MTPQASTRALARGAAAGLLALALGAAANAARPAPRVDATFAPTGQTLAPAGRTLRFFGHPLDVAVSAAGIVAIKNSHGLLFVDAGGTRVFADLRLPRDRVRYPAQLGGNGLAGIVWNRAGTTVWSADGYGLLRSASQTRAGTFAWDPDVELPGRTGRFRNPLTHALDPSVPTGVALGADERMVYVALAHNDAVAAIDTATRKIAFTIPTGTAPYGVLVDGGTMYVSNLGGALPAAGDATADSGGNRVRVDRLTGIANSGTVDIVDLPSRKTVAHVAVGLHPGALALSRDRTRVFVANGNGDSIGVIDTARRALAATIRLAAQSGFGAAPTALAVSPLNGDLYVAEGGDNRILQFDAGSLTPNGEIATAWYPSGLAFAPDGTLFATSLLGAGSRATPRGSAYNVYDYTGTLQTIGPNVPRAAVTDSSRAFVAQAPAAATAAYRARGVVPVPVRRGQRSVFAHVIYIIKENRTYDDYFGDLARGNGDPALCAIPRRISPNHHALAERFGIFDNFYANGTMSADGHQWTDEAGATDYVERSTASWARSYPSDGTDPLAYMATGFIWQRVLAKGLTFRDYGEFVTSEPAFSPAGATWSQFYRDRIRGTHTAGFVNHVDVAPLRKYVDFAYPGFTLRISDQARADEFIREFRGFERDGKLPNLSLMLLGNDHTAGTDPGFPAPDAAEADNDLALGRIVDAVSHSRYWKDTAVFVVEDDAQEGYDHVDGHRTMALAISAYNRRGTLDSHFYNQTSVLATIEAIFGLAPLTQFDAHAPPIVAVFQTDPDLTPYAAHRNGVPLDRLNPKAAALSGRARAFALALSRENFDAADRADAQLLKADLEFYRNASSAALARR